MGEASVRSSQGSVIGQASYWIWGSGSVERISCAE